MPTIKTLRQPDPAAVAKWTEALKTDPIVFGETVDCDTYLLALDLADADQLFAALALGITPRLVVHDRDEPIWPANYDWYDQTAWQARMAPANDDQDDESEAPPPRANYAAGEVADAIFDDKAAGTLVFPAIEIFR